MTDKQFKITIIIQAVLLTVAVIGTIWGITQYP
jgi:hypothetical protein